MPPVVVRARSIFHQNNDSYDNDITHNENNMTLPDPVLYDDKITIINIAMNEGEDDVVYNDVMNVEEFLEEHNIRYIFFLNLKMMSDKTILSLEWTSVRSRPQRMSSPR